MQKKILVLAIAAAISAPAFADTTVYGLMDAAVLATSGSGLQSSVMPFSGGLASSRLGVKATEKLDNGMTGVAVMEYGIDSESGAMATATARQTMLAVAGDFGTAATGYLQTAAYDFAGKYDVVAGSMVSPLLNITKQSFYISSTGGAARAQRAVAYISPNIGGFVFAANYAAALAGTGNFGKPVGDTTGTATAPVSNLNDQTAATLLSVNYATGPVSVGAVYSVFNMSAAAAAAANATALATGVNYSLGGGSFSVTEFALGGSYDMGFATVKATFQDKRTAQAGTAGSDDTVASIGALIPVGHGTVALSYASSAMGSTTKDKNGATVNLLAANQVKSNTDANGYTVAYLQGLSKTTTAYVAYSTMNQGADTSAYSVGGNAMPSVIAGGATSVVAVGLSKKF